MAAAAAAGLDGCADEGAVAGTDPAPAEDGCEANALISAAPTVDTEAAEGLAGMTGPAELFDDEEDEVDDVSMGVTPPPDC
jgi:hypothetical protein